MSDTEEGPAGAASEPHVGDRWRGVKIAAIYNLDHGKLFVSQGSVVNFEGDAIVNAANTGCLGGGGVDGAITDAGGDELHEARLALPLLKGKRCNTGSAVITGPASSGTFGSLHVPYVIHAVGPNYNSLDSLEEGDSLLESAYATSMVLAAKAGLATVGFSLLSAGIFRGRRSLSEVLGIAARTLQESSYPGLQEVHLVAFTPQEVNTLKDVAGKAFGSEVGSP